MKQTFAPEGECANCHDSFNNIESGGIKHTKFPDGWYTGYLCTQCTGTKPKMASAPITQYAMTRRTNRTQLRRANPTPAREYSEAGWLNTWCDHHQQLYKLFGDYSRFRNFAATYGYGIRHIPDLIRHKELEAGR